MDSDVCVALQGAFQALARADTGRAEQALRKLERVSDLDAATNLRLTTLRELLDVWTELPDELRAELATALTSVERVDDSAANLFAASNPQHANELKQLLLSRAPTLHSLFGSALASDPTAFAPEPISGRSWVRYAQIVLFFVVVLVVALKSCGS